MGFKNFAKLIWPDPPLDLELWPAARIARAASRHSCCPILESVNLEADTRGKEEKWKKKKKRKEKKRKKKKRRKRKKGKN